MEIERRGGNDKTTAVPYGGELSEWDGSCRIGRVENLGVSVMGAEKQHVMVVDIFADLGFDPQDHRRRAVAKKKRIAGLERYGMKPVGLGGLLQRDQGTALVGFDVFGPQQVRK